MKVQYEGPLHVKRTIIMYKGIHDVVNDQGFAMHYRAISKTVTMEVFRCERINTTKQKDGLISFVMLSVLEAKIFNMVF